MAMALIAVVWIWLAWEAIAGAIVALARTGAFPQAQLWAAAIEIIGPLSLLLFTVSVDEHGVRGLDGRFKKLWPVAIAAVLLAAWELLWLNPRLTNSIESKILGMIGQDVGAALFHLTVGWAAPLGAFAASIWGPLKIRASSVMSSLRR